MNNPPALKGRAALKLSRMPRLKDVIRWYRDAGLEPVVNIDYARRKVSVHPKAANDLESRDPLASDIERAFGGR